MKIRKLLLKNFGVYEEKEFLFNQVAILLDRNGAGKSTVLKALNFALSGDFKEDMVRNGADDMSVTIFFDSGLIVMRSVKNGKVTHKMGYDKPKTSTKEKVNLNISQMTNTDMNHLKIIASSAEIFHMKPEELSNFFMSNIPNTITADKAVSYIEDITPQAEKKVRSILPSEGEFSIECIHTAYDTLYEERKEISKVIRNDKNALENYDFSVPVRSSQAVQNDLTRKITEIGALEEINKRVKEWERLKQKRQQTLETLRSIQTSVKELVVSGIPQDEKERELFHNRLKMDVDAITKRIMEITQTITSTESVLNTSHEVVERLKKGFCPQLKGMKCPYNWNKEISKFEANITNLQTGLEKSRKEMDLKKKELADAKLKLFEFEKKEQTLNKRQQLIERYNVLRPTLQELPEEPKPVDVAAALLEKSNLEKEFRASIKHEQLLMISKGLTEKEETLRLLNRLVDAFSPKGDILAKNLQFYLDFFEKQLNEKAAGLGFTLKLESQNGLIVRIGKKGRPIVNINSASAGEKAIALFLLLDLFNSITGVNLLFFDEIEGLDNEVFENLMSLVKDKMYTYDHIVIAGVDHEDTKKIVRKLFF